MKKSSMLLYMIGMLSVSSVLADEVCKDKFGTLRCGNGTVDNVSYTGFVETDGTTVTNRFDVLGSINVTNSILNTLKVRGESHFSKTTIHGVVQMTGQVGANDVEITNPTTITGDLIADHMVFGSKLDVVGTMDCEVCTFKNEVSLIGDITTNGADFLANLSVNTQHAFFSNTKLNDVDVKYNTDSKDQILELKNGSKAHNINFESQRGIVMLSSNSQITGTVQGGKIIKK